MFVDFWNYTLSTRDVDAAFRTDWSKLGPVLSRAAAAVVDAAATGEYQGLNFYGSHDPARDGVACLREEFRFTRPGRNA